MLSLELLLDSPTPCYFRPAFLSLSLWGPVQCDSWDRVCVHSEHMANPGPSTLIDYTVHCVLLGDVEEVIV